MGIYLRAKPGEYADKVLVAGDYKRIERLAGILENARRITDNRGLVGFTGSYHGERLSVQSTGMGCPSMAMVGKELLEYGVRTIVRIGTCSAFAKGVKNGDLIIVTGTAAADGTTRSIAAGAPYIAVPDFNLTSSLVKSAQSHRMPYHVGPIVTVDVEPHLTAGTTESWRQQGLLAVEMESAILFYLALRASASGPHHVSAATVLTVSDGLEGHPDGPQKYLSDDELTVVTDKMHQVALEAVFDSPSTD